MSIASSPALDARYPIGRFQAPEPITTEDRRYAILAIADLPEQMREAVRGLDDEQLNTPYREGGWTVRQLVHHVADSHMIAFYRLRLALTEEWPSVQGYNEKAFAALPDTAAPVEWSLEILESVHARWVMLLQTMDDAQWQRGVQHSERGPMTVERLTLLYGWHSEHHVAHITHMRAKNGW